MAFASSNSSIRKGDSLGRPITDSWLTVSTDSASSRIVVENRERIGRLAEHIKYLFSPIPSYIVSVSLWLVGSPRSSFTAWGSTGPSALRISSTALDEPGSVIMMVRSRIPQTGRERAADEKYASFVALDQISEDIVFAISKKFHRVLSFFLSQGLLPLEKFTDHPFAHRMEFFAIQPRPLLAPMHRLAFR